MFRRLAGLGGDRRGAAAVEFALATPVLLACVLALADLGLAANERMRLISAVRAGAQYAMRNPSDAAGTTQAVLAAAAGLDPGLVSVTLTQSCGCSDGSQVACAGTCLVGSVRSYVTVTASETYSFLVTYPGVGDSLALSANASFRIQ